MSVYTFAASPGTTDDLLGRESEFALLEELLDRIPARGGSLLLEGRAGMGKTSLLRWVVRAAAEKRIEVWWADGTPSERHVPFAAVSQLLAPVRDLAARLAPDLRAVLEGTMGLDGGRPPRVEEVSRAFTELARQVAAPLLIVVDDLHWLDAQSAEVLSTSVLAASTPGVGLLSARRSHVWGPQARPPDHQPVHRLGPLDRALARALVRRVHPTISDSALTTVVAIAGGNPLALVELPAGMSDVALPEPALAGDLVPLSPRLEHLYAEEILSIPPGARQRLLLAALDDGQADLLTGLGDEERAGLVTAQERGLIRIDESHRTFRFRHPLVGPTVIRLSSSNARRAAHRTLASQLEVDDDRYAWHLAATVIGTDEDVATLLEGAAERALRRGHADASIQSHLLAARLSTSLDGRARRLVRAAYVGAESLGSLQQASALLDQARRAHPTTLSSVPAATVAAHVLMSTTGELDSARRVLAPAITAALDSAASGAASVGDNRHAVAEALHHLLDLCLYASDEQLWTTFRTAVTSIRPEEFPDLRLRVDLLADPVRTARAALPELEAALSGLDARTDASRVGRLATAAFFVDRVDDVRPLLLRHAKDAQAGGPVAPGILALSLLSTQCIKTGHWAEAERWARQGLALCEQSGYLLYTAPFEFSLAMISAMRGDSRETARTCARMLGWALPRGIGIGRVYAAHAHTVLALGTGDFERAYREISAVCEPGTFAPHLAWAIWMSLDLVEAAMLSGHRREAAAHVDAMHEVGLGALSSRCALAVAGATALAAPTFSRRLFEDALAVPDAGRWPFELARIQLRYGQALRRARFTSDARPHLEAALATFERLSAGRWAEQARTELWATSPTKSTSDAPASGLLTPQERVVAELAAKGMTNKEIAGRLQISPRTVGAHLRSIFEKLGVRTRATLTDALAGVTATGAMRSADGDPSW